MGTLTWKEVLQGYLEKERQIIHDCSADYNHTVARKGMEQDFEDAAIRAEMLEDAIRREEETEKSFMD